MFKDTTLSIKSRALAINSHFRPVSLWETAPWLAGLKHGGYGLIGASPWLHRPFKGSLFLGPFIGTRLHGFYQHRIVFSFHNPLGQKVLLLLTLVIADEPAHLPCSQRWTSSRETAPRALEKLGWKPQVTFSELARIMVDADLKEFTSPRDQGNHEA